MHRGCFMWTPTPPLAGRRMLRPGPVRVCVCLLFLVGSGGPASRARSGAPHLFIWPLWLSALLGPLRAEVAPVLVLFLFLFRCRLPRAPFVSCFLCFPAPGALGLGAVCCLSCWPRTSRPSVRSRSFCVACLAVGCCLVVASPPPFCFSRFSLPPLRSLCFFFLVRALVVSRFLWFPARGALGLGAVLCVFFSSRLSALRALSLFFSCLAVGFSLVPGAPPPPPSFVSRWIRRCRSVPPPPFFSFPACAPMSLAFSGFRPRVPWALALCFVCFVGLPLLGSPCALSSFCVSPGCSLLPGGCCPPPPCRLVLRSFFFCVVRPRCLRLSLVSGPGCLGPRRCALFALLASRFSTVRAFSPLSCLLSGRWLLPGGCCPPPPPPPAFCVPRFSLLPLGAVCRVLCCAVYPGLRCCAALLRVVLPGVVLLCAVLFCCARLMPLPVVPCPLVPPVALGPCALRRCVLQCSPARVCFVVVWWCVLLFAALLCAVCVLGCCAVRSLSSLLCAMLGFAVLVRLCCAVHVVRAVAGARCCGALLCVVLFPLVCCGAVLGLVAPGCLLVPCCGALLSVSLCWWCWFVSFPCVCGAVLRCASCCSVPVESALLSVPRAVACPCVLWCLPGHSAVWWCLSGVSWCLAVLCVVLWCPAPCAVSCGAVLPCGVVLVGCAVRLSALLVFFLHLSSFPLLKTPAVFPCL